jgi:hypothetical protein
MGLLINNELIWISIPKCASSSIENALLKSNLKIEKHWQHHESPKIHLHIKLNELYDHFGKKETICITRDPLERWISALKTVWLSITFRGYTPVINWEDIDNGFLYKTFDKTFINNLHSRHTTELCNFIIIKDYKINSTDKIGFLLINNILLSQQFWKNNKKCTYEFSINELYKVEEFLYKKYKENIKIPNIDPNYNFKNNDIHKKNKIIIDDELRNWYWENFENRFEKNSKII